MGVGTMRMFRQRKSWIVLIAVLLLFAACKGETPTAPPSGTGTPPGGTAPPTGVSIALATTSANPLVDSTVTITATVTQNGAPVPDGTAVEFSSNGGVLTGGGTAIIRTTTNGIASVTLTSTTVRTIRVSATVNNVTRTIDVGFVARPVEPQPPNTAPTITSVTPAIGRPGGGEIIRIIGTNFRAPVRVLFDLGGAVPVEGSVVSVSADGTQIEVVTPPINLGAGQQFAADIIVLTQAGSTNEQRVESAGAFTYRNERLTPIISTVTPNSGPILGGTRVTIIGEGFQEPVQVLFDTAEARVLTVTYNQILVETPAARDTSPTGSGTVTGPVNVTVRNIASNTQADLTGGFLYKAAMQITAVGPGSGSYLGGTRLTIDGIGFVAPVTVTVAGRPAQVISVSGTRIIVLTPATDITGCADIPGAIVVTNNANGDSATGGTFIFDIDPASISNIQPSIITLGAPGNGTITVTVANAQPGQNRFLIGDSTVFPTSVNIDPETGVGTFTVPVPSTFEFPTEPCGVDGEADAPIEVDVTYTNVNTGCTDTATNSLTVNPPDSTCRETPAPEIVVTTPVPPGCLVIQAPDAVTPTTGTIRITNSGDAPLSISAAATPNPTFTVLPTVASIPPAGFQDFTVTYTPGGVGTNVNGNVAFTTNDEDEPTVNVCLTGDPTP
jgi:hypothetical protein